MTPDFEDATRDEGLDRRQARRRTASARGGMQTSRGPQRGSVLIIVIWVCLGLVALTLYFSHAMVSELRASDQRGAEILARQAVAGGTRYAGYLLSQFALNGAVPRRDDYRAADLPIGDAVFWFIGRDPGQRPTAAPVFGLVDEASKINLNTAPRSVLEALPALTPELVDAILSWRNRNQAGANDGIYGRLDPPRLNKAEPFESVDELRLVYGATLDVLFGEDTNRNGALDDNENDGDQSGPRDDADGLLQPGLLEYVTVHSREPNTRADGQRRINLTTTAGRQQLNQLLRQRFGGPRAATITEALGGAELRTVADLMARSPMTFAEFVQIRGEISTTGNASIPGLININTASETVLACLPGIGTQNAGAIAAYRLAHPEVLSSMAWLSQVLNRADLIRALPYLTDRSYQFSADVAAVGPNGRGYCREKTLFDMTRGTPRIIYHQDLTSYGWALGSEVRRQLREARDRGA